MKTKFFSVIATTALIVALSAHASAIKLQLVRNLDASASDIFTSSSNLEKLNFLRQESSKSCSQEPGATIVVLQAVLHMNANVDEERKSEATLKLLRAWLVNNGFIESMIFPQTVEEKSENARRSRLGIKPLTALPGTIDVDVACSP